MSDQSRRGFFRDLLRQGAKTVSAFNEGREEQRLKQERDAFFGSYESSYALTLCEDELLIETAQMAGIETEGKERLDIAKELFALQGSF
ncbi:MAG: hypothetical protein K9K66_11695 [Desulfarculaceae bacterium]|nr:hypothetical protein [Desulfarculaceae bacterium]MCF8071497.1 hypothetical protein [Desulfarculaceae bacterium]MCF8102312.1 hypothetical protein [Desulfarculaceae bacterium]MCF8114776.1 hypothetical protein [Desulfarculaceae bacterium]